MSHLVYQLHNNYATYAEFDHFFKKPPSVHCPHTHTSFHYNTIKLSVLFLGCVLAQ